MPDFFLSGAKVWEVGIEFEKVMSDKNIRGKITEKLIRSGGQEDLLFSNLQDLVILQQKNFFTHHSVSHPSKPQSSLQLSFLIPPMGPKGQSKQSSPHKMSALKRSGS